MLLHLADLHIGRTHPLLPDLTERTLQALGVAFTKAQAAKVQAGVIAGDVFHSPTPHPVLLAEALRVLRACPFPLLLLPGNHDASRRGYATAPLEAAGLQVAHQPGLYQVGPYRIWAEPWPRGQRATRALPDEARNADYLLLHGALAGREPVGEWGYALPEGHPPALLGHIHVREVGHGWAYPGPLLPGNFQEGHATGGLLWGVEGARPLTLSGEWPGFYTYPLEALPSALPKGAVLRVLASAPREQCGDLEADLRRLGVPVSVRYPDPPRRVRALAARIRSESPLGAYRAYLEAQGREAEELLLLARCYLEEVC